jgi:hypothetical protein
MLADVLKRRHHWLIQRNLPNNTVMEGDILAAYKKHCQTSFNTKTPRTEDEHKKQKIKWHYEMKRLCGSKRIFYMASFYGAWNP